VDLGRLLKRLPAEFELSLADRNAQLTIDAPGVYPARANEMVSEVFANLISNAIKYGPTGGAIEIGVSDAGDRWRVSFADSGEGIALADRERVFTRFERAAKEGARCSASRSRKPRGDAGLASCRPPRTSRTRTSGA
jgi:two-component system, OmpR family, phosphate regulon sensor histidine kinase PhoR